MSIFESEASTFNGYNQEMQEERGVGRQNSILSLTLEEFEMKSGKSLGTMNMDEFLANLWTTVEENDNNGGEKPSQGSLAVPVPLCKKTVDEVWLEIQNGLQQQQQQHQPSFTSAAQNSDDRQQTLGEITLEDFLVKAGVVQEPSMRRISSSTPLGGYNPEFGVGLHSQTPNNFGDNRPMYTANRPVYPVLGESSRNGRGNQYLTAADSFRIKKRIIDGPPEILMERRQRRMIKNRESAARSRARRQAYTVELELELNNLTEENTKLKKIVEENETKRRQEIINRSKQETNEKNNKEKLSRIRRVASAGW